MQSAAGCSCYLRIPGGNSGVGKVTIEIQDRSQQFEARTEGDEIVVWDGGANGSGKSATSGFLSGLSHSLPPMLHMMRDIGGVDIPEFFGKLVRAKEPEEATPEQAA